MSATLASFHYVLSVRDSHEVAIGCSHGREPMDCKTHGTKVPQGRQEISANDSCRPFGAFILFSIRGPRARARGCTLPSLRD